MFQNLCHSFCHYQDKYRHQEVKRLGTTVIIMFKEGKGQCDGMNILFYKI